MNKWYNRDWFSLLVAISYFIAVLGIGGIGVYLWILVYGRLVG